MYIGKLSIASKFGISLGVTSLVLIAAFSLWAYNQIESAFGQLEKEELTRNLERIDKTFAGEKEILHASIIEWAAWDDTYYYGSTANSEFIKENIGSYSLNQLRINLFAVIDSSGKPLYQSVNAKLGDSTFEASPEIKASIVRLVGDKATLSARLPDSNHYETQAYLFDKQPVLLTLHSLRKNSNDGPSHGLLIFGRFIDDSMIHTLSAKTQSKSKLVTGDQMRQAQMDTLTKPIARILNHEWTETWYPILGSQGKAVALIHSEFPRQTMESGHKALMASLIGMISLGAGLCLLALVLTYGLIIRRLHRIDLGLTKLSDGQEAFRFDKDPFADELGRLPEALNRMLNTLAGRNREIARREAQQTAMLDGMLQGLCALNPQGQIFGAYAKATEKILNCTQLNGQNWNDLIWHNASLSEEIRQTTLDAMELVLQGNDFQVELNIDQIPLSAEVNGRFLEFEYRPLFDPNGMLESLLISMRDVTELREMERVAELRRQELQVLEGLLEISPQDLHRFCVESHARVQAARLALAQLGPNLDTNTSQINAAFRELHTIKGNARILGFADVSSCAHNAEDPIQIMRATGHSLDGTTIAQIRLNWLDEAIEKLQTLYLERFSKLLQSQSDPNTTEGLNEGQALEMLGGLSQSAFTPINSVILTQFEGLSKIAPELGKPMPRIQLPEQLGMLKNVLIGAFSDVLGHCLRNCMDHGIEKPEHRSQIGKNPQGQISFAIELKLGANGAETPMLWIWDDGAGLNMPVIQAKHPDLTDPYALAMSLFEPGFSTREQITEISGRGVGLDFVKAEWEKIGGEIQIVLEAPNAQGFCAFKLGLALPRLSLLISQEDS